MQQLFKHCMGNKHRYSFIYSTPFVYKNAVNQTSRRCTLRWQTISGSWGTTKIHTTPGRCSSALYSKNKTDLLACAAMSLRDADAPGLGSIGADNLSLVAQMLMRM